MALRESDLNGYCLKGILVTFWKRAGFEGGEREVDLLVHAHCVISLFSSISSLLSSVFSLIFIAFLSLVYFYSAFFLVRKYPLFFDPFFRARQGSFNSACRGQYFTTLPLNRLYLVWAYLPTTKSV